MAILSNPEIPLSVKPPALMNLADVFSEQRKNAAFGLQQQQAATQQQTAGLEQEALRQQNQERGITMQENQAVKDAITKTYQGGGSLEDALPGIMQASPTRGSAIQKTLLDNKKIIQEIHNSALDHDMKTVDFTGQVMSGVKDQTSHTAALATLHAAGVDTSKMNPIYDPAEVQATVDRGKTIAQKLADVKEQREAAAAKESLTSMQRSRALNELSSVSDQTSLDAWNERHPVMKGTAPTMYSPAAVAQLQRQAVPVEKQPEFDLKTAQAKAMQAYLTMDGKQLDATIDGIIPKNDPMSDSTKVLLHSAASRGDTGAISKILQDAYDQRGRVQVAKESKINAVNIDMGAINTPQADLTAKGMANYQIAPLGSFAMKTPAGIAMMGKVMQLNPDYHSEYYDNFRKTESDATTGKIGTSANALNTMMGHLSVLNDAAVALKNGNVQALNKIGNFIGIQTGNNAQTAYETIVHRLGPEVTKAYLASGGSVGERGTNEQDFALNLGPDQIKANIGVSAQLADSKIKALQDQYQRGTYGRGQQKLISDEAEQARQRLAGQSPVQGIQGAAQGSAIVQHSPSTGAYRYSTDGGKTWQAGQPPK